MVGRVLILLLCTASALAAPASAQPGERDPPVDPARIDCAALAAMPNPPMTRAACETMAASAAGLSQAASSDEGARPGDETVTCEQIVAEMSTQQATGVSTATAQRGQHAGEALRAELARQQTQAAATSAAQMATGAGMAAAGMVPGGGMAVGAVAGAQHAANMAQGQRNAAAMKPLVSEAMMANAAASGELAASMRANPRFGRLVMLAGERGCSGDF